LGEGEGAGEDWKGREGRRGAMKEKFKASLMMMEGIT
jgi:hypothetical protein